MMREGKITFMDFKERAYIRPELGMIFTFWRDKVGQI
jgi:hypothetical protein